jgi:hypothetical protein
MSPNSSLLPREHGAYAQLAFPLVTGLALALPSLSTLAFGASAAAFFLANESAVILLGARGKRLQERDGPRAKVWGGILLGAGGTLGAVGLSAGWPAVWPWVLFPFFSSLLLVPVVLMGREKTLLGELLVITSFATLILPMAAASGVDPTRGALASAVWWLSFGLGTIEVRAIKARHKGTGRIGWTGWVPQITSGAVVVGAAYLALGQGGYPLLAGPAAALLLPALAIFSLSLFRVHPKRLKRVGWSLVAANSLALLLLLQG